MIDSIKIILKNFSGNFDNCIIQSEGLIKDIEKKPYHYNNYLLYNHSKIAKKSLYVSHNLVTGVVTLTGSLRKMAFNRGTLNDMSQEDFIRVLKRIAYDLNISFDELRLAKFTQCEIGANIRTRIPAIDVLPMIVGYSNYERRHEGTLYFKGKSKERELKLYVKDDEIAARAFSGKKSIQKKKSFDILKSKGIHHLRIELTMNNHRAFKNKGLDYIRTIGDLIEHYSVLYELWTQEVSSMVFYNKLKYEDSELTKKEKEIILGIEESGYFDFLDKYQEFAISKTTTAKSKKSAKSRAIKEVYSILDRYFDKKEYNKFTLRADVAKYLIRKSNQSKLDLPILIRYLWGIYTITTINSNNNK